MSKIIPKFYLPKEYPEDMRILVQALIENDGEKLNQAIDWLTGKMISHTGRTQGQPKKNTTIKNYLDGIYVLDLFSSDNLFYSDKPPSPKVSLSRKHIIHVKPELKECINGSSIDRFNEKLTQICSEQSFLVKEYKNDKMFLKEKYGLPDKYSLSFLQKMLIDKCNYSYVDKKGMTYLDIFYQDKMQIDDYLQLMNFILENYRDFAKERLGLIPVANILNHLKRVSYYTDEMFKKHLIQLQLTHRIELRTTKSQLARNMGIDLLEIRGVKYGFIKILEQ